jgi:hypothetical protein
MKAKKRRFFFDDEKNKTFQQDFTSISVFFFFFQFTHKIFIDGRNLINNDPKAITPDNLSSLIKIHGSFGKREREREKTQKKK